MKNGLTPKHLAWSVAIGMVIGLNPLLGVTTVVMLFLAWVFRLNHVASQIGTHLMAPIQLLLFVPFLHVGTQLFHTHPLPMDRKDIVHLSHRHPLQLVHLLWRWEWHGLVVWAVVAVILAPLLQMQIRRMLVMSMRRHADLLREA